MFNNGTSLADIAAVTNSRNNGSFGGDGWWILIILFALFGGFGNNGIGNGGQQAMNSDMQRGFDAADIHNKLNSIGDGICSLGYDQLQQVNGVNQNVTQIGYNLAAQIAECCCKNEMAISQVRFDMSTYACDLGNRIDRMGRDIMENDNRNYRAIHDQLVNMQMQEKDARIAELTYANHNLQLTASQNAQTDELTRRLQPKAPIPSYVVPNPNGGNVNWGWNNGWNGDCCYR